MRLGTVLCVCIGILAFGQPVDTAAVKQEEKIAAESALFKGKTDPTAKLDVYPMLSEVHREVWARESGGSLAEKIEKLQTPLETTTSVEVKLIGFSGDGQFGISLSDVDFAPYLEALKSEIRAHVLDDKQTTLPLKTKFFFRITSAPHHLAGVLQNAIHRAVEEAPQGSNPHADDLVQISHSVVDNVLKEDFHKSELAYTIYLLNPTSASKRYIYHYRDQGEAQMQGGTPGCPGPLWVSGERYLWVDLTAGPTTYGPHSAGEGVFLENSLPRPEHYPKHQHKRGLVADLVGLLQSACDHLLAPPIAHANLRFYTNVTIQVIRITDKPLDASGDTTQEDFEAGLDLEGLQSQLRALGAGPEMVDVLVKHVSFGTCDYCVAAYTRALRSHITNAMWRPPVPKGKSPKDTEHSAHHTNVYQARTHDYLDSKELHAALQRFEAHLWTEIGLKPRSPSLTSRVIAVYLYDLSSEDLVLLDRHSQVTAFPDMLLAVRSRAGETLVDYSCGGNAVLMQPHNMARPLLGGVLEAVWGVAPTQLAWRESTQSISRTYAWSVGLTPFGPFGSGSNLSFVQKDAAVRNMIMTHMNMSLTTTLELLQTFAAFNQGEAPLNKEQGIEMQGRWNVLHFKLHRAARTAAIHNFNASIYWALSAHHEVRAMHEILTKASRELKTTLKCFEEPETPLEWYIFLAILIGSGIYFALLNSGKLKHGKQF